MSKYNTGYALTHCFSNAVLSDDGLHVIAIYDTQAEGFEIIDGQIDTDLGFEIPLDELEFWVKSEVQL